MSTAELDLLLATSCNADASPVQKLLYALTPETNAAAAVAGILDEAFDDIGVIRDACKNTKADMDCLHSALSAVQRRIAAASALFDLVRPDADI